MERIKVTHINPTDIQGGASLAGYRLHKDLLNYQEFDSVNYVNEKYTQDKEVIKFSNRWLRQIERVSNKLGYFTGLQYMLSINWLPLPFKKRFRETDVFIIRNIHGGLLPLYFPWVLSKFAPVIWRLPDMWPFTGKCVYSYDCERWKNSCYRCPILKEYPPLFVDASKLLFKIKKYIYGWSNLHIVAPSTWMLNNLKQSPILSKFPHYYIPPGVDTGFFKPGVKNKKPTLIFVSSSLKDKRKGGQILPDILELLNQKLIAKDKQIDIYWAGINDLSLKKDYSNINNIFLGQVKAPDMAVYYAKSHLHILPTLADNLPNTLLESMACGTPAVVFDVGGCKDVVIHNQTGYLAKINDIEDFVSGIVDLLLDRQKLESISREARELIENKFTLQRQTNKYLNLIKSIVR